MDRQQAGWTTARAELGEQDWGIRLAVYRGFVAGGGPPTHAQVARQLDIPAEEARQAYHRLHRQHALFLEPGTDAVRMANPLSAVPTAYRVHAGGRWLWANCAWDSLGIPAMLHADARIEATYAVAAGRLAAGDWLVHFPLPFRRWYDDLIHT